jgi:hypothetical protein
MSLSGADTFSQVDNVFYSISPDGSLTDYPLSGKPKFMGHVLPQYNMTRVGIQDGPSELIAFQGPDTSLEVSWQGIGVESIFVEGQGLSRQSGCLNVP